MADLRKVPVGTLMVITTGRHRGIHAITKVGKRYVECGGMRWEADGHNLALPKGKWACSRIALATPAIIADVQQQRRQSQIFCLMNVEWDEVDLDTLDQIYALLTQSKREVGNG